MIETLFVCNPTNGTPKETNKQQVHPVPTQENRVLDQKKSQNIAILLRALNVTKEEVCEALSEGTFFTSISIWPMYILFGARRWFSLIFVPP